MGNKKSEFAANTQFLLLRLLLINALVVKRRFKKKHKILFLYAGWGTGGTKSFHGNDQFSVGY